MNTKLVERLSQGNQATKLLPRWIAMLDQNPDTHGLLPALVDTIRVSLGAQSVAYVQGTKGHWRILAETPGLGELPTAWLADVLDNETAGASAGWIAASTESPMDEGWLLVARMPGTIPASVIGEFDACAAAVGLVLTHSRRESSLRNRAERLQALLDVTVKWSKTRNSDELLLQIAETSTKLLRAERATIFLIDHVRKMLVGKPALGVAGGELLIPLDTGVVGRAITTNTPQRVDTDIASEQAMIHRDVDERLRFETRSLICVPIHNAANKIIGAFELINKLSGNFNDDDEIALCELADHAAIAIENSKHVEQLVASKKQVSDQAQNQFQWIGTSPQI